jgi:hypothetical protein
MAIASIGTRGTAVSGASTTTIARAPTATVDVGRCLVAHFATRENIAIDTVTDAAGNTWEFIARYEHSGTGDAHNEVWLCNVTTQLTTGTNITATFASAVVDKCMALWEYSVGAGTVMRTVEPVVGNQVNAANGFGSAAFSGLASAQRLYFRSGSKRANSTGTITATSGYTTHALNIRSRNSATLAITLRAEHLIATNTGTTSNPTWAVSGNTAANFVAFEEYTPPAAQTLTQNTRFDNGQTFHAPTVTVGPVTLTQGTRYDNDPAFYAATITQGGGGQTLLPGLYTNTSAFYAPTVTATRALTPVRFDNTPTFYAATVTTVRGLTATRLDNAATFFGPTVAVGAVTLTPARFDNAASFYSPLVTQGAGALVLGPDLFVNTNTFYGGLFTQFITFPDFVEPGHVEPGWVGWPYFNAPQFFAATVQPGPVGLFPTRYDDPDAFFGATVGEALLSGNRFQFIRRRRRC